MLQSNKVSQLPVSNSIDDKEETSMNIVNINKVKNVFSFIHSLLIVLLIINFSPINAAKNQTLRKKGETKAQMMRRLIENEKEQDPFEKRIQSQRINVKQLPKAKACQLPVTQNFTSKPCCKKKCNPLKNFEGFWQLDSIDSYQAETLIEFFRDCNGKPFAHFFDGTQNNPREKTLNDEICEGNPASTVGTVIPVEVLGPRSLRFFNNGPILSKDDLTSTFRIQDEDPNTAYGMLWTNFDGTGDSPEYGIVLQLARFLKLPNVPNDIQLNRLPSLETDWTNPVEMFKYMVEYYSLMGEPQKAQILETESFIGWPEYEAFAQTMLTTGTTRTAQVSEAFRGGDFIGVWRTQFPDDFPLTTITTTTFHHMTRCSTVNISGFTGAYAVLNGERKVAAFPNSTTSLSTPFPWQDDSSREQYLHIIFDSSNIAESYDPALHGVATLVAHHGPVTPDIGYRDFMAAVLDFVVTAFGGTTHTAVALWTNAEDLITVPESFEDLQNGLANDSVILRNIVTRTNVANSVGLYWNPAVLATSLAAPVFNLNDPFGLGLAPLIDPNFNYDITIENYLDKGTVKNIFFTVTGPTLSAQPITNLLTDIGYTSNGSQVVFKANDFQTFPEPLVDQFGEHEWMQYAAAYATNSTGADEFASYAYFGGIVRPEFSDGKTVAYIRIFDEDGFDGPFYELTVRSLVFGRKDIQAKYISNYIAAWAALLEELNKHNPDRYILDIRRNGGGFAIDASLGTLFGADRVGVYNYSLQAPGNGYSNPTVFPGSDIQTVFDSIPAGPDVLQCNEAAVVFPNAVVRSTTKEIELIILDQTFAASGGSSIPHLFVGPDPDATIQNLGGNVIARIIGDTDARLNSAIKMSDALPINTLSHNLIDVDGIPVTATYFITEAGLMPVDRHGYIANPTPTTQPNLLLPGWYDQTEWQDLGLTPIIESYPLGLVVKPAPVFGDNSTWRDVWLENAIVN